MPDEIDTTNDSAVAVGGDGDIMILAATPRLSKAKALRLAAWIVALADPLDEEFTRVLNAVKNT